LLISYVIADMEKPASAGFSYAQRIRRWISCHNNAKRLFNFS
jgi:hypothetical protein